MSVFFVTVAVMLLLTVVEEASVAVMATMVVVMLVVLLFPRHPMGYLPLHRIHALLIPLCNILGLADSFDNMLFVCLIYAAKE